MFFELLTRRILLLIICFSLYPVQSLAQISPDDTLDSEKSTVRSIGEFQNRIEGGAIRGENLFHSFEEFNVDEGLTVDFANPEGITNIFSRVTGGNLSEIFGTLKVNGAANLLLMNPNGIIFGEDAAINVNGSFLATTAQNLKFNDGNEFSSVAPDKPLLTINVPIGLGFGSNPGSINVNDKGHNLIFSGAGLTPTIRSSVSPGLQTSPGENFALLGGEINLNGGVVIAEGGKIEIGGVKQGFVGFDLNLWKFDYSNVSFFGNVNLANTSWLDASSTSLLSSNVFSSGIQIKGQNIAIEDESVVLMQNQSSSTVGEINLNAVDSIVISKVKLDPIAKTPGGLISETLGDAQGSNIKVISPNLTLLEGGSIISKTLGLEKSGDIYIQASDKLELIGISINDNPPIASNITNAAFPVGKTGFIDIETSSLKLKDGGTITNFVAGQAFGNTISINAENVELSGSNSFSSLSVSSISTSSSGLSQAANISINANDVRINDGTTISSLNFDFARSGKVNINAANLVKIQGINSQTRNPSSIASTIFLPSEEAREAYASLGVEFINDVTGDSGNVNINTPKLEVADGGLVTVLNQGTGNAGSLQVNADSISLINEGAISASTASGQGGNVTLNTNNLQLLDLSQISVNAGGMGDGGNITINSDTIIGIENSDITANAIEGNGGRININSDVILGFVARSEITEFSDITASSNIGIDGTTQINTPDISIQRELEQSKLELLTTDEAIANSCLARSSQQGSFTINDNGGLPKNPNSNYNDANFSLTGVSRLSSTTKQPSEILENTQQQNSSAIPAQKMIETRSGRIFLVAAPQKAESLYCKTKAVLKDYATHKGRRQRAEGRRQKAESRKQKRLKSNS